MLAHRSLASVVVFGAGLLIGLPRMQAAAQEQVASKPVQAVARKPMADPDPSFDVATIKPSDPAHPGRYFRVVGRTYYAHDASLADLIDLCYGMHPSQIIGAPAWVRTEKFDVVGTEPGEDEPSGKQWLAMVRHLLTERFALTLHKEERDLSSYVLSIDKNGPKNLAPTQRTGPGTSLEFNHVSNGLTLPARNATLGQFCQMMQQVVLDRPVVDHTGLTERYDFRLTFLPNDSQFDGRPPITASQVIGDPAPELFEALRTQLGLKLEVAKVPTGVLIVEHVERPSAN